MVVIKYLGIFSLFAFAGTASAAAFQYECAFFEEAKAGNVASKAAIELKFIVDEQTGDAVLVGSSGMSKVLVWKGDMSVTFLETLPTGGVQNTTVLQGGEAVHSRHTIIAGQLAPSQYLGLCKATAA